jgi:hypothetical protein
VPKLPEQVRDLIRLKHYSIRREAAYLHWIKEYITSHKKRHPPIPFGTVSLRDLRSLH